VVGFSLYDMKLIIFRNCRDASDYYSRRKKVRAGDISEVITGKLKTASKLYFVTYQENKTFTDYVREIDSKLIAKDRPVESIRAKDHGTKWHNSVEAAAPGCTSITIQLHCGGWVRGLPAFRFTSITHFLSEITLWSFEPEKDGQLTQIVN
jgi:hypothetical protein